MRIIKIYNNNIASALSDDYGEIIVTGSGIGFQKRAGDLLDESKIEKTYLFQDKSKNRLNQMIAEVPIEYLEIADAMFMHDELSEDALKLKCNVLCSRHMSSMAMTVYDNFCKSYFKYMGEKYLRTFQQICR